MKAKVISTGKVIEVIKTDEFDPDFNSFLFKDINTLQVYMSYDLEFMDERPQIDWEQRRFDMAKAAMQGILSNPSLYGESNWSMVESAVAMADAIIAKLKEE